MAFKVKDLAAQLDVTTERLVAMLEEAEFVNKTEDSELTDQDKRKFLMKLYQGRVRQVPKHTGQSVIQPQRRTGSAHEIVVEIKGGHTLAPRTMPTPQSAEEPEELTPQEIIPEEQPEEETEQIVADSVESIETVVEDPTQTDVPPQEVAEPATPESQEEPEEESAQAEVEPEAEPEQSKDEKPAEIQPEFIAEKESDSPKRTKQKRKSGKKQEREQLHVAKGREKLQRERERRKKSRKLDDRITQHTFQTPSQKIVHSVSIADTNAIRDLAQAMSVKAIDVMKYLIEEFNLQVTINGSIDRDTATLLVEGLGHVPVEEESQDIEEQLMGRDSDSREHLPRPPVVAVMGHVDHGKTTLLDSIRSTKVAASEKGGITQHIGAYMVETPRGKITFLDTPGHEAFTAMRVRGAKATDIVILVVAADDGVMPQTVEAINHARIAGVPIIVAINKIDKNNANPGKILRELTEHNVIAESLGGDVQVVEISALKNTGIDNLLERIQLQAELMDVPLTAPVEGLASGVVIEARVDKGRGAVVTVLVQKGKLTPKQIIVAGVQKGKIRQLTDYRGKVVKEAKPSTPIEISGFSKVPEVGDEFICPPDERSANQLIEFRLSGRSTGNATPIEFSFGDSDDPKVVNVLVKADVSGSAEAVANAVTKLSNDRIEVKVIHAMVGGISQSDVNLAIAANAMIVAFNVRAEATAKQLISTNNIQVIYSSIIYEALDSILAAIRDKVGPTFIEEVVATANVLEVFKFSKIGTVAGCYVEDGTVRNKLPVRVVRDNVIIHNGQIDSLRRFQNDVNEVKAGLECGIQLKNYHDIHIDDMLEVYEAREAV
ncbi:MAG: translation initiation factor IF-2 [Gammaproteobacteria bacterium]|nr:translation initiation factor IF-2 [Gammaproteobacteria bacterium]